MNSVESKSRPTGKLFGRFSGLSREPVQALGHLPLIVAIHGGTYTSRYFDVPGFSLLSRASSAGMRTIAPDRNGYGSTPKLPDKAATIADSARSLAEGLQQAWQEFGTDCTGLVLIGHSIGAAVAAHIAADPGALPVLGVAISGLGLRLPRRDGSSLAEASKSGTVDLPTILKDSMMFGPVGSYDGERMPAASHVADSPSPSAEIADISGGWPQRATAVLEAIRVPVYYRQGQFDRLWIVDEEEVNKFERALTNAPRINAAVMSGTGHCIDFHHDGEAFQQQQLRFALECSRPTH